MSFGVLTCAALLCGSVSSTPAKPVAAGPRVDAPAAVTSLTPEVRLRKLHLVRPDLIPYPIEYEVVC